MAARRKPHPLFDVPFYLRENPEVAAAGIEPLSHFLEQGSHERTPAEPLVRHRSLRPPASRHPRVRGESADALSASRRPRRSSVAARNHDLAARTLLRAPHPDDDALAPAARGPVGARCVLVSHVGPWRPKRRRTDYRVARLLRWYRRNGYRVIRSLRRCPVRNCRAKGVEAIAAEFGNAVRCPPRRTGRVNHFPTCRRRWRPWTRSLTRSIGDLLWEPREPESPGSGNCSRWSARSATMSSHQRCFSSGRHLGPHVLQVEYIWMTRVLPLVPGNVLKVVDTIDVFSNIQEKVSAFGLDDVVIQCDEEAERLRRADLSSSPSRTRNGRRSSVSHCPCRSSPRAWTSTSSATAARRTRIGSSMSRRTIEESQGARRFPAPGVAARPQPGAAGRAGRGREPERQHRCQRSAGGQRDRAGR